MSLTVILSTPGAPLLGWTCFNASVARPIYRAAFAQQQAQRISKSRALNINLSATLEQTLKRELALAEASMWTKENKTAITAYNSFVEENGCFGDEFSEF